mgnify:CR=1 FL=1
MIINKGYRIGLRAIKTAIAVFFCALISTLFKREDIFCASIATVICMEQTYKQTIETGMNRFIGTIIGGAVGYVALELSEYIPYYEWVRIFVLPFCILSVIYICNMINRKSSVSIGCVVVLVILARLGDPMSSTFIYVVFRVMDTLVGVFVATVINRFTFGGPMKEGSEK